MDKNLICIVFVMFAGCSASQQGAQMCPQNAEAVGEQEPLPDVDKPRDMDPETRAAYEETLRRHPPSPMLPSLNRDR